jgi:S-adenosylmethionine hydrolase
VPIAELGPPLDEELLVRLDLPEARVEDGAIVATVLGVDRYGNVQLNLVREQLGDPRPGAQVRLETRGGARYAVVARTFADVGIGELVLLEDSNRSLGLAVAGGDAASLLAVRPGDELRLYADR